MEKVKKLLLSSLCLLSLLPATGCKDKILVNNVFAYLVHESCLSYGKIAIMENGEPKQRLEGNYQWHSVMVGEYGPEMMAVPNDGYAFVGWKKNNLNEFDSFEQIRQDLAIQENDSGPVVYYAFFEAIDENIK